MVDDPVERRSPPYSLVICVLVRLIAQADSSRTARARPLSYCSWWEKRQACSVLLGKIGRDAWACCLKGRSLPLSAGSTKRTPLSIARSDDARRISYLCFIAMSASFDDDHRS